MYVPEKGNLYAAALRKIPAKDLLLSHAGAQPLLAEGGREFVGTCLDRVLDDLRSRIMRGENPPLDPASILAAARALMTGRRAPRLRRVINATGVILHTGLGRAVLPKAALDAVASEQAGYSLLEVDPATGERSTREIHVAEILREITGAESATVVNNNAGATLLALAAVARGGQVIVSRGQLVEIGGSFRIPDVMRQSGAELVEVGTTNKTYISDYESAVTEKTALLMRVHTSNYRIVGFTHFPTLEEIVELGRRRNLPVMDDLGSGSLVDLAPFGVPDEPTVQASVKAGADVVAFSGDKLLGGPQAGILLGTRRTISRIRAHPLFRALRVDKLKLTALEATLGLYLDRERLFSRIPTLRMIAMTLQECAGRASSLAERLRDIPGLNVEVLDDRSEFGGGSVPTHPLPTKVVAVRHASRTPESLSVALRAGSPPVFGRLQRDRLLFDVRTIQEGEEQELAASLRALCAGPGGV